MTYESLLYVKERKPEELNNKEPDFFIDLNLDQIVDEISEKFGESNLRILFLNPLKSVEDVRYRQEIFSDLEQKETLDAMRAFYEEIKTVISKLSNVADLYDIQREGRILSSAHDYIISLKKMQEFLRKGCVKSTGLKGFANYLGEYLSSEQFRIFEEDLMNAEASISSISYSLIIEGDRVTVKKGEPIIQDFSTEIQNLFSVLKEKQSRNEKQIFRVNYGFGHVQAEILKLLEKIYPDEIKKLRDFSSQHGEFLDKVVLRTFYDIQFYLSYLDYIEDPKKLGLPFCLPKLTTDENILDLDSFYDIALASKLSKENKTVVTNDIHLKQNERIVIITGPNSGGKTTFSRSIGQVLYLASLGLPVPARSATLSLPDKIFTHFEKTENVESLRGKLEDDLLRLKEIIDNCTEKSLLIINEMLSSTTVKDALSIGKKILRILQSKGCLCFFVTFLGELSSFNNVVSIVGQINEENPEMRTYKFDRGAWNGLAYATALTHKHRVSYNDIIRRIGNGNEQR
ncbi:MAG: hypothetical protein QXW29_00600 [Thermoplasmatales archaeon]